MVLPRLQYLFDRHLNQTITSEERRELFAIIHDPSHDIDLRELIDLTMENPGPEIAMPDETAQSILEAILGTPVSTEESKRSRKIHGVLPFFRWLGHPARAAAVVGLLAGATIFLVLRHHPGSSGIAPGIVSKAAPVQDVAPGGDKAILTLGDGSTIVLDSVKNGLLSRQGGSKVTKTKNGLLSYAAGKNTAPVYNMITTPIRGQYQVDLPDGTKVWLNSLSSLRFPTAFTGRERLVEITGEAYFEVAKDAQSPFVVRVLAAKDRKEIERVQVLGTAFDVMGYEDEPEVRTTLVSGVVRVSARGASMRVNGGQQTQVDGGSLVFVPSADVEKAVAWRNGNFQFEGDDIGEVMRQLTRWYGVDVKYEFKPQVHYTGGISRNLNLTSVLHMLSLSGLHCRIEGNTLFVMP